MSKISNLIDNITGKTEADLKLKEQLTFLQKMGENKAEVFQNELKLMLSSDTIGNIEITGKRAFRYFDAQHVNISREVDRSIDKAIDDFFMGSAGVKAGFQKIVKQSLDGLIGNTSIGETTKHMFFVYPENFAVVRVDVKCYKYTFSSKDIFANNVENVFVYTMAKSIVDHTKLSVDELIYMVTEMIGSDKIEGVKDFVKELRSVWKMLEDDAREPANILTGIENGLLSVK